MSDISWHHFALIFSLLSIRIPKKVFFMNSTTISKEKITLIKKSQKFHILLINKPVFKTDRLIRNIGFLIGIPLYAIKQSPKLNR